MHTMHFNCACFQSITPATRKKNVRSLRGTHAYNDYGLNVFSNTLNPSIVWNLLTSYLLRTATPEETTEAFPIADEVPYCTLGT